MKFQGHQFVILGEQWVFDMTEFKGYKITYDASGELESFEEAFDVEVRGHDNTLRYHKEIDVPLIIMEKTEKLIRSSVSEEQQNEFRRNTE